MITDCTADLEFTIEEGVEHSMLAKAWRDLESRSNAPFFLSWNWIGCWLETASIQPDVIIGRAAGRIVLLGLLVPRRRLTRLGIPVRGMHLHNTGDPNIDVITIEYNGFLVDRSLAGSIEKKAITFLLGPAQFAGRPQSEIHLKNFLSNYEHMLPDHTLNSIVASKASWRVDLEAVRLSDKPYLDHLSSNTRQQIRRSIRLYEREGPLTATRARTLDEAIAFMDQLKRLHQVYWTGRGKPGGFSYPYFEKFHHHLINTCLPRGEVELIRIARGSSAIGYLYNFVYGMHVYAYQSGFLYESDPKLKPGLVSHYLCIEMHLKEGNRIYDFMAGDGQYKASLGARGPDMGYFLVQRPTCLFRADKELHEIWKGIGLKRTPEMGPEA